jgi:acylphosphatase
MIKYYDIRVSGKVQGVSYRAATKAVADQLGVKGIVKNEPGGDVWIEAEGDELSLSMFLEWCHEGPEHAEVTAVQSKAGELKNYRNFEIIKRAK